MTPPHDTDDRKERGGRAAELTVTHDFKTEWPLRKQGDRVSGMYLAGENGQRDLRQQLLDLAVAERREAAADALAAAGAPAVSHLLIAVNHADAEVRATVHDLLVRIGEPAVDPLCRLLPSWNPEVRLAAVAVLGRLKHPRSVTPLCAALSDPYPQLQSAARVALGSYPASITPALCHLWLKASRGLREQLALVLNNLGEGAAEPLCALLSDPDPAMRTCAAYHLGRRGDRCAVDLLKRRLSDPSVQVRAQVATILGQLREKSAGPLLLEALRDAAPEVRAAAAEALGEIGDPASVAPLLRFAAAPRQREAALSALCRLAGVRYVELGSSQARSAIRVLSDGPTIDFLCRCLHGERRGDSVAAARLLAGLALHAPLPELRQALPSLRRQRASWWSGDVSSDRLIQFTIRQIEQATAAFRDLPIPAPGPVVERQTLPLPAGAPHALPTELPLPARDEWREDPMC